MTIKKNTPVGPIKKNAEYHTITWSEYPLTVCQVWRVELVSLARGKSTRSMVTADLRLRLFSIAQAIITTTLSTGRYAL